MAEQSLPLDHDVEWETANEIVVATEHLGFVREHLASHIRKEEHSDWLGLSRLLLSTFAAAEELERSVASATGAPEVKRALVREAAAIDKAVLGEVPEDAPTAVAEASAAGSDDVTPATDEDDRAQSADAPGVDPDDPMATVLADLRTLAIVQHGGWMPTIGRNRLVELPGSGALAVTSKTSYGKARATGGVDADSKTSYGGSGAPQPIKDEEGFEEWAAPGPRASGPGTGVRVGLIDTQLWPHPWLAGGWVAKPSDLLSPDVPEAVTAGHATFIAGLILSRAPGATIEVRSALDEKGEGTTWQVASALAELAESDVSVINLSLSCYTGDGQPPLVLARAVDRINADVVVVAAAGNHGDLAGDDDKSPLKVFEGLPAWPAALDDVIAVGSLDEKGQIAGFSPERPWIDVAARGTDLRSTFLDQVKPSAYVQDFGQGWAEWSGTSFSAALVSGAIAAGVDPGRVSGRQAAADLLSTVARESPDGKELPASAPGRLALRIAGWARMPKDTES
jgi:membrane-anchored mycosin MYCP